MLLAATLVRADTPKFVGGTAQALAPCVSGARVHESRATLESVHACVCVRRVLHPVCIF